MTYLFRLEGVFDHLLDSNYHHGLHSRGVHGDRPQEDGHPSGISLSPSASDAGDALHLHKKVQGGERSNAPWQVGSQTARAYSNFMAETEGKLELRSSICFLPFSFNCSYTFD